MNHGRVTLPDILYFHKFSSVIKVSLKLLWPLELLCIVIGSKTITDTYKGSQVIILSLI